MQKQKVSEAFKLYVTTMDLNKCILCQSECKNLSDLLKALNPRVCGYTLPANNIEKCIGEGLRCPKK